jgi:16S rRNA A1518/A1519 N6-dimethyltransferase RsmA/KsgA/DIM1 with predicted DNA glycosylase/AP lyase activity
MHKLLIISICLFSSVIAFIPSPEKITPPTDLEEYREWHKLYVNFRKKQLLTELESNKYNIRQKMEKIETFEKTYGEEKSMAPDIMAGGLLDDWNYFSLLFSA